MRHISDATRWTAPCGAGLLIALLVVLSACATSAPAPRTAKPTNTPAPLPTATRAPTPLPSPTAVINDISQLNLYGASIYTHSAISVHAADGTVRWKVPLTDIGCPLQSPPPTTPPVVVDGVMYFASAPCGDLLALRATDGGTVWQTHISKGLSGITMLDAPSLSVANGLIYTSGSDQTCARHTSDGSQAWCHPFSGDVTAPTYVDGILYVGVLGFPQQLVYALRATDGSEIWHQSVPVSLLGTSAPTVANGVVYVGSKNGGLFALQAGDGHTLWHALDGAFVMAAPVVSNGVVYASTSGTVIALDAATGSVKWRTPMLGTSPGAPFASVALAVDDNHIYADLDGIHALNITDGSAAWTVNASGGILSGGAIDIQAFVGYVLTRKGLLRGSDGSLVWAQPSAPLALAGPPAGIAP